MPTLITSEALAGLDPVKPPPPPPLTDEQRRAQIVHLGYSHGQLHDAFTLIQNKDHWKGPIDVRFKQITGEHVKLFQAAVGYFTGGGCTVQDMPDGSVRITARGYWHHIGA